MKISTDLPIRIYSARSPRATLVHSLTQAIAEVWMTREVVWRLFVRDFTVQFRQKVLGYLWVVINPLMAMGSFLFLSYMGVLNPGKLTIPYPLYLFFGMSLWGMLPGIITAVSGGLLTHGDLVLRTNIPKIALALSGVANLFYLQLVNLVILVALLALAGIAPSGWGLVLPVVVLPLIGLGLGIGLLLAVLGAVARDVTVAVTSLLNLFMYLTPVLYVQRSDNFYLNTLLNYNPLTYLIDGPRGLFFHGTMENPYAFAISSAFSFAVLAVGIHVFYMIQDKVAERL